MVAPPKLERVFVVILISTSVVILTSFPLGQSNDKNIFMTLEGYFISEHLKINNFRFVSEHLKITNFFMADNSILPLSYLWLRTTS